MNSNMHLNRLILAAGVMSLIILTSLPSCHRRTEEVPVEETNDTVYPLGFCTDSFALVEGKVGSG